MKPSVSRGARRVALTMGMILAAPAVLPGCRITEDDVHRWEVKQHGPEKLQAVLFYPKYEDSLRVEAALSLIRMKPRGYTDPFDNESNADGIEGMVKTLARIPAEQRSTIVASLVPAIITELKKPPPVPQGDSKPPPDPSFAFKDAAYAMFTYDKTTLITDETLRASLKQALIDWAMADFESRLENRTQKYSMEQLLRFLGADALVGIPKLMTKDARNLDKMSSLVAELGSPATKEEASKQLASIAQYTISDEWVKVKTPILQEANKQAKIQFDPDPKKAELQFKNQLEGFQDEDLIRVLGSMKKVGGRASIDFELTFAADSKQKKERRQAALAALEGKMDVKAHPEDVDRIMSIVKTDAPPEVLDQAFRRISELPKEKVLDRLYGLLTLDKWKVRRLAAVVALKMIDAKELDTFFTKLPEKDNSKGYAMPEAITISANMKDMKNGSVTDTLKKYMEPGHSPAQRTTALAYYYSYGLKDDLPTVTKYEDDKAVAPTCETDDECKWICVVASEAADKPADDGTGPELSMSGYWLGGANKDILEGTLKGEGFTDYELKPKDGSEDILVGKPKKGSESYSITFVPWKPDPIKQADVKAMVDKGAAVRSSGSVLLVIEGKDKKTDEDLANALDKRRELSPDLLGKATNEAFEKALKDEGFTGVSLKPKDGAKGAFTTKGTKDGNEFTFTFVPYKEPVFKPSEIAQFEANGAVRRAGSVVLVVEGKDKQSSNELAGVLVKKKKDIKAIGEFVKYCIEPAIDANVKAEKEKQAGDKKDGSGSGK